MFLASKIWLSVILCKGPTTNAVFFFQKQQERVGKLGSSLGKTARMSFLSSGEDTHCVAPSSDSNEIKIFISVGHHFAQFSKQKPITVA